MGITQRIGGRAEQLAAEWLCGNGFTLRHRNWRSGRYEIDIVAQKGDTLHFIEVKCRRRRALTTPEDAITPAKFDALCRAAEAYISEYGVDLEPQFDAIAVEYEGNGYEVRYIPKAMIQRW